MIDGAVVFLGVAAALGTVGFYAALWSLWTLWRRSAPDERPLIPMTLIKPVKGLDDGLAENFESIARSDPSGRVQVIIALESSDDPAYPVAAAFAARHAERDIVVLLSGPSGRRMGKTHNMIAALPRARHPHVIFSDADSETTPALLLETSRAFSAGREAVFALPRHRRSPGLGGLLFEAAMNHTFSPASALSWKLGLFRSSAGAWMAYSRSAIERSGGLEPIADAIADDFALSRRVLEAGASAELLPVSVPISETGTSPKEALAHLAKWAAIVRCSAPLVYLAVPVLSPGAVASVLWAVCEVSGRHVVLGRAAVAAAFLGRALGAVLCDARAGTELGAPWRYAAMAFCDVGALGFWVAGFRSEILWRGVRYRLAPGGKAEVLP